MYFEKNWTWELVPRPKDKNIIGTKWVFKKTFNENVVRNKEWLVCNGYSQVEGIDIDEIFFLVDRMEEIRMFLAFATHQNFNVYQMDVKYTFSKW
jgi:hypothetical protein